MSKIYFEMSDAERQLAHIYDGLDYANCIISEGLIGKFDGITPEMQNKHQRNISNHLLLAIQGISLLLNAETESQEEPKKDE